MLELNKETWKCANCSRYNDVRTPCILNEKGQVYPDIRLEPSDECIGFMSNELPFEVDLSDPNEIRVSYKMYNKIFTGTIQRVPGWDDVTEKLAIIKAKEKLILELAAFEENLNEEIESNIDSVPDLEYEDLKSEITSEELDKKMNGLVNDLQELIEANKNTNSINHEVEAMLEGDTKLAWLERVTSWKRVLNAARRTIGRSPSEKEPTDSWKAKILLAEHSPIRLLEYDFGWEKIRQWVTAHFVRHHQGCEKFVHSQRGDRRELPCDRDHIYQGAKNDMDMTANAQSLINISRKRCCMCASKETRDAWAMVLNELEKIDPVLRSKCVRECVYRGFCPEWMSNCKYCYSPAYWLELAQYRNTKFGKDETWKEWDYLNGVEISNIGNVRVHGELCKVKANADGAYVTIANDNYYIRRMMDQVYNTSGMEYIDGNKYNNSLTNLK